MLRLRTVNWKLFFVNCNQGLGRCIFRLFLVEELEIWDLMVNLSCKFSGRLPYRFLCVVLT